LSIKHAVTPTQWIDDESFKSRAQDDSEFTGSSSRPTETQFVRAVRTEEIAIIGVHILYIIYTPFKHVS